MGLKLNNLEKQKERLNTQISATTDELDQLETKEYKLRERLYLWKDMLNLVKKQISAELKNIEGGPENSREEVTGLGGSGGKNSNSGNSGFSGGCMMQLAAA